MSKDPNSPVGSTVWRKGLRYCVGSDSVLERFESSKEPLKIYGLKFSGTIRNIQKKGDVFVEKITWDIDSIPGFIVNKPIFVGIGVGLIILSTLILWR